MPLRHRQAAHAARFLALVLVVAIAGCGAPRAKPLTLKGSDTMVLLGQRWAESYMAAHPGAIVQVTGGGSGTGIAALINGTTEICQSSRPIKEAERAQVSQRFGAPPHEVIVARDGLALYVHPSSALQELTLEQIRGVYTGAITRWSQLGGPDEPIIVYGRENSSGTYEYFKEHVLGRADFAAAVQTLQGTAAVVSAVALDPRGIGYGGAAYSKGIREVAVRRDAATPAVLPTAATVRDSSYPIARPLYFYLRRAPEGAAKTFIDFVLSADGQKVVTDVGYFPVQ